jgi:hypothetical protein
VELQIYGIQIPISLFQLGACMPTMKSRLHDLTFQLSDEGLHQKFREAHNGLLGQEEKLTGVPVDFLHG